MRVPSDVELLNSVRQGDSGSLGALIERHRAGMRAVALALLGHRPEAEEAVQDAIVVALARIGELRDPRAAGPWLRAIVRNNCSMFLRSRRPLAAMPEQVAANGPSPEEVLAGHALRDWTFHALDQLTEPLQVVTLLRYFTDLTSYEEIAAFCGVPVGTVRSRLNEAKRKLGETLLAAAKGRYDDVRERTSRRAREAADLLAAADEGHFARAAPELFHRSLQLIGPNSAWGADLPFLVHVMDGDRNDGVDQQLRNVVAGAEITIWEMDLLSPSDDPTHCPPSVVWAHYLSDGLTRRVRLYHPATRLRAN